VPHTYIYVSMIPVVYGIPKSVENREEQGLSFLIAYLLLALGVLSLGLGVDKPREGVWNTEVSGEWRYTPTPTVLI